MTNRLEAVAVRKYQDRDGNDKTQYTNLGIAWPFRDKEGFTLKLNAFPAPQDGEYVILLVPPKQKEEQRQTRGLETRGKKQYADTMREELDDQIPF